MENTNWLASAEWGINHRDDGLSFIGVPDQIPPDTTGDSPKVKLVWMGPLPKLQAEWMIAALRGTKHECKQANPQSPEHWCRVIVRAFGEILGDKLDDKFFEDPKQAAQLALFVAGVGPIVAEIQKESAAG